MLFAVGALIVMSAVSYSDLRTHFDEKTPEINEIPTINPNLTGDPRILSSVPDLPLNNSFNVFNHSGLDALDSVLSHWDDPDWGWRNASILELIVHEFHVLANVKEVSKVYKKFVKEWKKRKQVRKNLNPLCNCLKIEDSRIITELQRIDTIMQGTLGGAVSRMQMNREGILVHQDEGELPELKNEAA